MERSKKSELPTKTMQKGKSRLENNRNLVGMNLYLDPKGRIIYKSSLTNRAVYINPYDEKKFGLFKQRYLIVLAAFFLLWTFMTSMLHTPFWMPVVLSLLLLAGLEYSFQKFLSGLQPIKHYKDGELISTLESEMTPQDKQKVWLKTFLYCLLGIFIVINAYQESYSGVSLIACWIAGFFCIGLGGYQIFIMNKFSKLALKTK